MEEDVRSLKQMSHEMPFKNLIWKFSWEVGNFRGKLGIFASKPYLRNSHKLLVKHSIQTSWLSLLAKTPRKHFYHTKSTWKTLKNMGDTNHFQKQIKLSKTFWFNPHMVEHTHITFEYVQIHKWSRHSLNIRLVCYVCGLNMD